MSIVLFSFHSIYSVEVCNRHKSGCKAEKSRTLEDIGRTVLRNNAEEKEAHPSAHHRRGFY